MRDGDVITISECRTEAWWFRLCAWLLWHNSENLRYQFSESERAAWNENAASMDFRSWLERRIWGHA